MSFTDDLRKGVHPYRDRFFEALKVLQVYLKNPIREMGRLPHWDWATLLFFYTAMAACSGLLAGFVSLRISQMIVGLIIFPISATIGAILLTGFFYYICAFFFHREVPLKLIFTIVVFSLIPFFALYTLSGVIEPIRLVGLAAAGALMTVGLAENTGIDRRKIMKLIGGLYLVYFIFWAITVINWRNENKHYKELATPESYDKLNQEFSE